MPSIPPARGLRLPEANPGLWERECGGKSPYTSEAAAEAALAFLKRSGGVHKPCWLTTYRCSFCGSWHIGHTRR